MVHAQVHVQVVRGTFPLTDSLTCLPITTDEAYTCVGRTPKTIRTALEAYVASTTSFGTFPSYHPTT